MFWTKTWKKTMFGGGTMTLDYVGKSKPCRMESPAHRHAVWELIYNAGGSGTMTVGGQTLTFEEGTILLVPPEVYHSKRAEQGFEDFYMGFTDADLPRELVMGQDAYDGRMGKLMQVLHSLWYENGQSPVCAGLGETVLALIRPTNDHRGKNEHVRMLRDAIAQGFTDPDFSVREAMEDLPLSADHLRRLFVRELGQTPHEYLTQLRLGKAKRLLSDEHCSVAEAAYRCGFYDALYFSKVFRKATGVPPSRWG